MTVLSVEPITALPLQYWRGSANLYAILHVRSPILICQRVGTHCCIRALTFEVIVGNLEDNLVADISAGGP